MTFQLGLDIWNPVNQFTDRWEVLLSENTFFMSRNQSLFCSWQLWLKSSTVYVDKLEAEMFVWVSTWQIASEELREENVLNRSTFDTNNTMFRSLFTATLLVEHDTEPSIILATFPKNLRHSSSSTCTPSWWKGFTFSARLYSHISDLRQDLNNYSHSLRLWVNIHSTHYRDECVWCN